MDEYVEALAVQHQPRDDVLKLPGLEDDAELRDRVRTDRLVAEGSGSDGEPVDDRLTQPLGGRPAGLVVIDMGVIAFEFGHWGPLSGLGGLCSHLRMRCGAANRDPPG